MKNVFRIIFCSIILMLMCSIFTTVKSQTVVTYPNVKTVLTSGSFGYVTVNGQNYKRGYLGSYFSVSTKGDSLFAINYQFGYPSPFIQSNVDTNYQNGDAANGNFPSMDSLHRWINRNFEYHSN